MKNPIQTRRPIRRTYLTETLLAVLAAALVCPATANLNAAPGRSDGDQDAVEKAVDDLKQYGIYETIRARVEATRYDISQTEPGPVAVYQAINKAQDLRADFTSQEASVVASVSSGQPARTALRLSGVGYGTSLQPPGEPQICVSGNRIEYCRPMLTEWYVNGATGIEQGFLLESPPGPRSGDVKLVLCMTVRGDLQPQMADDGQSVLFQNPHGRDVLRYSQLEVKDATGRTLPARLAMRDSEVAIELDDRAATYPVTIDPLIACQTAKLTASDGGTLDFFGSSGLSIDGDTVVVGAAVQNSESGSAYVFERNAGGPENWGQVKKLTGSPMDLFGHTLIVSGDTLIVASPGSGGSDQGAVYIFERNTGGSENWGQVKKLTASDGLAGDFFGGSPSGRSLSLSGDTLLVAAPNVSPRIGGEGAGAAYVFERNAGGSGNWGQVKKLTGSDVVAGDRFGSGVSISGDTLVCSVAGNLTVNGGVYVFERNAGGTENWGQVKKVENASLTFGDSPSLSGDTLVVASASENFNGAAYVFERNAGGAENWGQVKRITPNNPQDDDLFGISLVLSGDRLLVGAEGGGPHDSQGHSLGFGAAYIFERNAGGVENWGQVTEFSPSDPSSGTQFGVVVALSGRMVGIGTTSEKAYVFELNNPPVAVCKNVTKPAGANCQATGMPEEVDNGSSDPDGDPIALSVDPPGPYPLGQTTVTLTVTDSHCGSSSCTATVTVVDRDPPLVVCKPAPNPSGNRIPPAGQNPKSGQNPDGFYQLSVKDNCDANPTIYVQDSITGFLFGPFKDGDIVKITQSNHDTTKPGPRPIVAHIQLVGDAFIYGVDASGNVGATVSCLVPPPPKQFQSAPANSY
jgi:hypothetical protein